MIPTLLVGLVVSVLAFMIFSASASSFSSGKSVWSFLQLFGAACLLVVGLCHICEAVDLFPWMHWGSQRSVGHYLDLSSCVLGLTLFPAGYIGRRLFHSPT